MRIITNALNKVKIFYIKLEFNISFLIIEAKMKFYLLLSIQLISISVIYTEHISDVTKFGADIKGVHKSTDAIHKAIDDAVSKGGGTVFFPKGEYLSGPIHLKSNIALHLEENAIIKFSQNFDDYLPMNSGGTGEVGFTALINAYKVQNIAIRGKGVLDGQGSVWWAEYLKLKEEYQKTKKRESKYQKEYLHLIKKETDDVAFPRPLFINPYESKHIIIEDITLKNSPMFHMTPTFCEDLTIRNMKLETPVTAPNTDGIDPNSCKNVLISNVQISVGDDCMAMHSRGVHGSRDGHPLENVLITGVHCNGGHAGFAIGTGSSGAIRNITVANCVYNGVDRGLSIKTMRGRGGVTENIHFHNITMNEIKKDGIFITMFYAPGNQLKIDTKVEPFSDKTPIIRNIEYKDIKGSVLKNAITMAGLPESPVDGISLTNINLKAKSGINLTNTKNVVQKSVVIEKIH